MHTVAKLVIVDGDDNYLMMYRNNHPRFGDDPDLPGGTGETGETALTTMIREVWEEIGVNVKGNEVKEIYSGTDYSAHGTHYSLFITKQSSQPKIEMSWEHSSYEWLSKDQFLKTAAAADDTYMHMTHDTLKSLAH